MKELMDVCKGSCALIIVMEGDHIGASLKAIVVDDVRAQFPESSYQGMSLKIN